MPPWRLPDLEVQEPSYTFKLAGEPWQCAMSETNPIVFYCNCSRVWLWPVFFKALRWFLYQDASGGRRTPKEQAWLLSWFREEIYFSSSNASEDGLPAWHVGGIELILMVFLCVETILGGEVCACLVFTNVKWQKFKGRDISVWGFSSSVLDQSWKCTENALPSLLPGIPFCLQNRGNHLLLPSFRDPDSSRNFVFRGLPVPGHPCPPACSKGGEKARS